MVQILDWAHPKTRLFTEKSDIGQYSFKERKRMKKKVWNVEGLSTEMSYQEVKKKIQKGKLESAGCQVETALGQIHQRRIIHPTTNHLR